MANKETLNYIDEFETNGWFTPNTYGQNFAPFPETPGVYAILHYNLKTSECEILYIGSAKNIKQRIQGHEVRRILSHFYEYMPVHFKECTNYREVEGALIRKYKPKFNRQLNG